MGIILMIIKKTIFNLLNFSNNFGLFIIGIGVLGLLSSCRKENEETYFKSVTNQTVDTTYVTYSKSIKPIFDSKCISCHVAGTSGNCDLDSYENTMMYINSHQPSTKLHDYISDTIVLHEGVIMEKIELQKLSKWVQNPVP